MVNEIESTQAEGYDFYDAVNAMAFNVFGGAEVHYVVGTNANAAVLGSWPTETGVSAVSLLVLPVAIGANVFPVVNAALFAVGDWVRIVDAAGQMDNVVAAILPGNILVMALPSALAFTPVNLAAVYSSRPDNAQNTLLIATQACFIRLRNVEFISRQGRTQLGLPAGLPAGVPVQIPIQANTFYTLPDKWVIINVVGQGAAAGTITIKTSG